MHIQQTHVVPNEIPPVPIRKATHPTTADTSRCYYLCVQSLSNLMQTFILTLQENISDVHHLVDFAVMSDTTQMSVAQMYPLVQAWHIFMHASFYY